MAQTEDTELRDLVIEALERNGSLAKIRALLRANIFLAFEDDCQGIKQNARLDSIFKLPEGVLSLAIVHEFLEFCNLKNTLFVYMSESRQGKDYTYEGQKLLSEKLNLRNRDITKEPVLVTLIKNLLKPLQGKHLDINALLAKSQIKKNDDAYKDDQNNTYIVHDDSSSATSNSHSDNSLDEKNKLHLQLQLDHSDTDTSSDSMKDKSSSEYIPNAAALNKNDNDATHIEDNLAKTNDVPKNSEHAMNFLHKLKIVNSSSESTSYIELKSHSDKKLNTTSISPAIPKDHVETAKDVPQLSTALKDNVSVGTLSSVSSISVRNEDATEASKIASEHSDKDKADGDTEYSYDFTPSPVNKNKENSVQSIDSPKDVVPSPKNNSLDSQQDSQSSVSISDVTDLISEKSSPPSQQASERNNESVSKISKSRATSKLSRRIIDSDRIKLSDASGDYSESPIPSLSNLSLDIHSD